MARVLVVDDEPVIQRLLQLFLQSTDHQVITAVDGLEALALVEEDRPEIIFLDVMMPNLDGIETLRRLRADADTAQIPVVLMSASAEKLRAGGTGVSADAYLVKPFGLEDVLHQIEVLVKP